MSPVTRSSAGRFTVPRARASSRDELFALWAVAAAEANLAFDAWASSPGLTTYTVFLAAEDRASAAQDALART